VVVSQLLALIGDVQDLLDLDEFRAGLLAGLSRAIPSKWASLNDVSSNPEETVVLVEPDAPPELTRRFTELAHQNPLIQRYARTQDGRAYRFSDLISQEELHRLDLYREVYSKIGVEHQVAFTLPHKPPRLLGVALSRDHRDFSDAECNLINEARPFLIQAYRNAIEYSRLAARGGDHVLSRLRARGLTEREAEVVQWVAMGRSNRDIGTAIEVSERTVQKHLERSFRKLGVRTRSEAAELAWSLSEAEVRPNE
jgi:DNA-binding CsgD family transcriptional regulator